MVNCLSRAVMAIVTSSFAVLSISNYVSAGNEPRVFDHVNEDEDYYFDVSDWSETEKRDLYTTAVEMGKVRDSVTFASKDEQSDDVDIDILPRNVLRGHADSYTRELKKGHRHRPQRKREKHPKKQKSQSNDGTGVSKGMAGNKEDAYNAGYIEGYNDGLSKGAPSKGTPSKGTPSKGAPSKGAPSKGYYGSKGSKGNDTTQPSAPLTTSPSQSPVQPPVVAPSPPNAPIPLATPEPTAAPVLITPSPTQADGPGFTRCFNENAQVQCPDPSLAEVCDKYSTGGLSSFRNCYGLCKEAFCCIHDSNADRSLSCSQERNCEFYKPCYIVWWKLVDTIGPAPFLRIDQNEDFYDVNGDEFGQEILNDVDFFNQFFGHHFMTDELPLTDETFGNEANW